MALTRHKGLSRSPMKARKAANTESSQCDANANVTPRRSARKGLKQTHHVIPRNVREAVIRRSGGRCEAPVHAPECMGIAQQIHHRQLVKHGGPDHPSNLLHMAWCCHAWTHAHPAESYANGALFSAWHVIEEETA